MLRRIVLAVVLLGGVARAEVDWARGVIFTTGVGLADRNAPSPAVGRAASRRRAGDDATRKLAAALQAVSWVAGGAQPPELAARPGWIGDHAVVLDETLHPDGSWRVTLGLPIEAIRLGLAGPRALAAAGDDDDARTIVIDARAVADAVPIGGVTIGTGRLAATTLWLDAVPVGGVTIGTGSIKPPATTLWFDAEPPAALAGGRPIKRTATGLAAGNLTVDGDLPDLAGALIVVVVRTP